MLRFDRRGRRTSRLLLPLAIPLVILTTLSLALAGCSSDLLGLAGPTPTATSTPSAATTLRPVLTTTATPGAATSDTTPGATVAPASSLSTAQAASLTVAASPTAASGLADSAGRSTVASAVYKMAGQSVVNITSLAVVQTRQGTSTQPQGLGSGFVLDDQGYIATNNHVVADAAELTVTFFDGTTVPAQLIGRDEDNDLAVVKVDPTASDGGKTVKSLLKPVKLGDSSKLVVGEDVVAIGSPLGLQQTVTTGIVSALRSPGDQVAQGEPALLGGAVQTDAAINPGNSGGPLFNAAGEVMGVNTSIYSTSGGSIGLGFAIPVNVVKRVIPELTVNGCYRHPLIGVVTIGLAAVSQSAKSSLGIPASQQGLLVQTVSDGAADAGIRGGNRIVRFGTVQVRAGGDIITAIDGVPTNAPTDLGAYVENKKKPGDTVTISVLRDGQSQDVVVTLGTKDNTVPCR